MILSAHQPHFLPWLGYFNKVANSDCFVWLHDVQFRKNYFQNRTEIKNTKGERQWLTVPVHASSDSLIDEVGVAGARSLEKVARTVEHCYSRAPFFEDCWPRLRTILERDHDRLEPLSLDLFRELLDILGIEVRIVRSGDVDARDDAVLRLVDLCKAVGADTYLAGEGSRDYMDTAPFEERGIRVAWQRFLENHPAYDQLWNDEFMPRLSVIDALFNVGPERTRTLVREAWRVPAGRG